VWGGGETADSQRALLRVCYFAAQVLAGKTTRPTLRTNRSRPYRSKKRQRWQPSGGGGGGYWVAQPQNSLFDERRR
jgi:hypothetical protein